jgi:toxin ParE1/3/4
VYKYVLTLDPEEDLERIFEYGMSRFGILQAVVYYDLFFECFEKIAENSYLFPSATHIKPGFRSCVCGVDTIYYKIINENFVEISAIFVRQNFKKNFA